MVVMKKIRTLLGFLLAPLVGGAFFIFCFSLFNAFTDSMPILYALEENFSDMSGVVFTVAYALMLFISTPIYFLLKYLFAKTQRSIRFWHVMGAAALSTLAPVLVVFVPILTLGIFQAGASLQGAFYSLLFLTAIALSGALGGMTLWLVGGNPNRE